MLGGERGRGEDLFYVHFEWDMYSRKRLVVVLYSVNTIN
jgi:hypothetical protein